MLEHCCRDLLPFSHRSINEVRHWSWAIRLSSQSAFQFIPKVFDEVEVRALCRPFKFSTPILGNHFCKDRTLCTGKLSCWNCFHKVGSTELCRILLYAVVLRFPFTETKGPGSNHEKQPQTGIPHPPNFTVATMHWGMRSPGIRHAIHYALRHTFSWHPPKPDLSVGGEAWFITPGNAFRGWAVVAPRRFHFIITALTVDRGSPSGAEIWRTDLLERWHPMTVPELFSKAILLPMFVY